MTRNLTAKRVLWTLLGCGLFYGATVVCGLLNTLKTLTEVS